MISLALAAMFLPLSHFLIASTRLRGLLVQRFGQRCYLASYSTLTLAAFAWLIVAYLRAPTLILWATPPWLAALLLPVGLVGSVLMVCCCREQPIGLNTFANNPSSLPSAIAVAQSSPSALSTCNQARGLR